MMDGWKNRANWSGNHDRKPEWHLNHNLADFDDEEDVIGDDDFKHEIVGNGDGFWQPKGWRDYGFIHRG